MVRYRSGEPLKGLARRHDISRNLVRLWVAKYEAGELAEEVETAR
jgi:transposase